MNIYLEFVGGQHIVLCYLSYVFDKEMFWVELNEIFVKNLSKRTEKQVQRNDIDQVPFVRVHGIVL